MSYEIKIEEGKKLYNEKDYEKAVEIFHSLWIESTAMNTTILGYLGLAHRKNGTPKDFVDICRELWNNKFLMNNKFVSSVLSWCLYDAYIKPYDTEDKEGFDDFLLRAEYIVNVQTQLEAENYCQNPFFLTIRKVIKVFRDKASTNWDMVITWLMKLNPNELPDDEFKFDDNGKTRAIASPKEFFYQYLTKALEKKERFEECILYCSEALKKIPKFHYRNHLWFSARLHYCKCMISNDLNRDIEEYRKIADRENYWYMYHKLAQICLRNNDIDSSLFYASKAVLTKFEYEKMVNLFFDIAQLWEAKGEDEHAKEYYHASLYYRERHGWHLPEELRFAEEIYNLESCNKPNVKKLKSISQIYVSGKENKALNSGKVDNILNHRKSGFISQDNDPENIYFRLSDVDDSRGLKKGDVLYYDAIKQSDGKTRAINLRRER